ncbi:M14 family metallopeptidase [Pontixanthobacter gangjinensis]|uniref:DUF2817 domain-containing protein n=1 Tax=Pontixanthobacter gangjinensis TaxID=1028742 RepID=A0A6I4SSB2_9SPHN|nr:M14 family metallocarboxypeptidase [Pontixanthobacter gangjinensis]MXO57847.1 DUF2817 domain-containing protein [Pontixanthobacter gangjinensis]
MNNTGFYPIGNAGEPWGESERTQWRASQSVQRRYDEDVVPRIEALSGRFETVTYGNLDYAGEEYALYALRAAPYDPELPNVLVTGGVHGYETSGVMGALEFLETKASDYAGKVNLLVAPCVSPWAYERVNRWNYDAIDVNRSFFEGSSALECTALMALVSSHSDPFVLHIDLHETTDSDESEFRPALAARDGEPYEPGIIPDGFYLVDDSENPQPEFHKTIIEAVAKVTHIAPADEEGQIIGSAVLSPGVIEYPYAKYSMCGSITKARFTTTTEVYPDSPNATASQCNAAQVTAICAALDYAVN